MTLFMSRTFWIVLAATLVGAYLVQWGNAHGPNAYRLKLIQRELADVNSRIAGYTQRDEQAAIDAELLRTEGYHKALAELGAADKCIVTPAMVRAFERIVP